MFHLKTNYVKYYIYNKGEKKTPIMLIATMSRSKDNNGWQIGIQEYWTTRNE
jgi:hypothetical protein